MQEELEKLEGIVDKISYQNNDNGYTVARLYLDDGTAMVLVGTMPYVLVGDRLVVQGEFVTHPQYGFQMKVHTFEKILPLTVITIEKYLASKVIKGIGPITAKRIVEKFGLDTFDVIEHNPEWLTDIPGITPKKAKAISSDFVMKNCMKDVLDFCSEYVTPAQSVQIYQKWGPDSIQNIRDNPYLLMSEFEGIPFETCEKIAVDLNMEKHDINRTKAGILYIIEYNQENNGHVYLPERKLIESAVSLLNIEKKYVLEAMESLENEKAIVRCELNEKNVVYPTDLYEDERYIVEKLDEMTSYGTVLDDRYLDMVFAEIEKQNEIEYAKTQKQAVKEAFENNVFILTGGPGTGKTTIAKAMIDIFAMYGLSVELCAPTGRAAKRMSESTGLETKTIHRLLEAQTNKDDEMIFGKNESNPIETNAIIVDECSMIDMRLMAALLRALKYDTKLILIGDINQLPPVGAGFVFADIIRSNRYNTVELTHIFRQAQKSTIIVSAHSINNGEHLDLRPKMGNDFYFIQRKTGEEITSAILEMCTNRIPKKYKYDIFSGIQVISPSKKQDNGTESLNAFIQNIVNPSAPEKKEKRVRNGVFRVGDKVMQIKNNYNLTWTKEGEADGTGVYNGDVGIIKEINIRDEVVTVDFEGRIVEYDYSELDELELAYAITVHKSQGSEYPVVILPIFRCSPKLLTRNLLYTAVSRAKELVVIIGEGELINAMIDNNKQVKRYSGLEYLLSQYNR